MVKIYNTDIATGTTKKVSEIEKGVWINMVNPTKDEVENICEKLRISQDLIEDALDDEEKARIEVEEDDGTIGFIIDVPTVEKDDNENIRSTIPLGMIVVRNEYFITVSLREVKVVHDIESNLIKNVNTRDTTKMIIQIFYKNATEFLKVLGEINKERNATEKLLNNSMRNKELLKMLNLQKSLVYITTSLRSNEMIHERTLRGKVLGLNEKEEELLEDVIIENRQAIEMAKIYSNTLNGTMDAYASIISNNLNIVMKILTTITIIMSIPTILSGYWGMNVELPLAGNPFAFYLIILLSVLCCFITIWWFKRRNMLS
ncbi:MAG: magnesium transporter CorA family protein [Clostridia bacterium]|nr:magnesium transporter CorA family protein [Clostridia bacterium]